MATVLLPASNTPEHMAIKRPKASPGQESKRIKFCLHLTGRVARGAGLTCHKSSADARGGCGFTAVTRRCAVARTVS
jgi:hypothetical protein